MNQRKPTVANAAETTIEWTGMSQDQKADRRRFQIACVAAAVLHAGLFVLHFPEARSEPLVASEKPKVYLVQQPRFKKPEKPPEREIPKQRSRLVPIPDPDPESPEPVRTAENLQEPQIDLPDSDLVFDIPDAPPAPAAPAGPLVVGADVKPPKRLFSPPPIYTEMARRARVEGSVIVRLFIDEKGLVSDAKLIKGLPLGLTESALQAVRRWRFEPSTRDGVPAPVLYDLEVRFQIQ